MEEESLETSRSMKAHRLPWSWWLFFIGVVLVVGAILVAPSTNDAPSREEVWEAPPEIAESSPRRQTFETMMAQGKQGVYLENQAAGSTRVLVGIAVLQSPGFVVVHADNNGKPGEIIGSAYVEDGREHVTVDIDRPLRQDAVYYAMLHNDDGDARFHPTDDAPLMDDAGNILLMSFTATSDANPEAGAVTTP